MGKLVRDKIPDIIRSSGSEPIFRIISLEDEFLSELKKKLVEEVNEYLQSGSILELCDILEVLYSIIETSGSSLSEVEAMRVTKASHNGSFQKRIFLLGVDSNFLK